MRSLLLRLAGFFGAPVLSSLAPFIILPFISRVVGADGWANISAGQSIGILGMVAVQFGWGVLGPVRVARSASAHERAVIMHESLRSRSLLALVALPLAAVITFLVCSPPYRLESVLLAVAMAVGGFTPAWFCIGQGNPRALMIFDAVPKLVASVTAVPFLVLADNVLIYPILLTAFTLASYAIHAVRVLRERDRAAPAPRRTLTVIASMAPTAAIDATGNAYGATPVPIATAALVPAEASAFASGDRVYRLGLLAVIAFGNTFQAWVLDPRAHDLRRRHLIAFGTMATIGVIGAIGIALLGPWATGLLFGSAVAALPATCAVYALAFLFISCSTPMIRNLLIPAGRYRIVLTATVVSAVVGLAIMGLGAAMGSGTVIAGGVAAAEIIVACVLFTPAVREYRTRIAAHASGSGAAPSASEAGADDRPQSST